MNSSLAFSTNIYQYNAKIRKYNANSIKNRFLNESDDRRTYKA